MRGGPAWVLLVSVGIAACNKPVRPSRQELRVLADTSLTHVLSDLARTFESQHEDVVVLCNFADSQVLTRHVEQGVPGDVLATALSLQDLFAADKVGAPKMFAQNTLAVALPAKGVEGAPPIEEFADLARVPALAIAPADTALGFHTQRMLVEAARVWGQGFVDALLARRQPHGNANVPAIVFRTDVLTNTATRFIEFPEPVLLPIRYEVAEVHRRHTLPAAAAFVAWLLADEAQQRLRAGGFIAAR